MVFKLLPFIVWMDGVYAFPANAMAEGSSEESTTSNIRPAQLMDDMAVKEVFTQLEEAENSSIEVQQSLNEKTDNQLSPRLVYSGSESDWGINLTQVNHLRMGKSIAEPKLRCCR